MSKNTAVPGKISIALCTYNGARFLPEQLESFIKQTRLPAELVVGDDCSTDETIALIEDFAKIAPFAVRLEINRKNLGSTRNFEQTVSRCSGDLIFLADQDDVWFPHKIERVAAKFEKNPEAALIFSDAELVGENLEPLGKNLWDFTFPAKRRKAARAGKMLEVLLSQNVVTGATAAFRARFREAFTPIPDDVPNLIHDAWIALVIADCAEVKFIEEPLIKYRQHSRQQLGLNFQSRTGKTAADREKSYAASIVFLENEKSRLARMNEFLERLPRLAAHPDTIEKLIREKQQLIEHYKTRKNLPSNRAERLLPIASEILSGRYRRFSKSFLSAAKDLFEK